jgi:hypothetical protein
MLKSSRLMGLGWMRIVSAACMALVALGTLPGTRPAFGQGAQMGPHDVAEIPIESVPAWVSEGVARYIPEEGQEGIEVLAVLRDPRDVPIDRFLYALTDRGEVVVHPEADAIRRSLGEQGYSAVAVYVRATARTEMDEGTVSIDPFWVEDLEAREQSPERWYAPWRSLGVKYEAEGVSALPCLEPMTIGSGVRPFTAPDTGTRMQPDQYLPPMPQYVVEDSVNTGLPRRVMTAGEVREGWLLCLAPDVPAGQVVIVDGPRYFGRGFADWNQGYPYWAHTAEMPIGEWYLLRNRQVLGWNEDPAQVRGSDPIHLDEQVVYEGDVWVSVGQALRHLGNPRVDQDGISAEPFEEEIRLQMYFEGMEELLTRWDQLGLQGGMDVTFIGDLQHPWQNGVGGQVVELRAQGTSKSVGSSSLMVGQGRYREPQEVLWLYPGDVRTLGETGPIQVWRIQFQEIDERDLTTDVICAVTECVDVPVGPLGREVNTPLPLIPAGTRAFGVSVQSARFIQFPFLRFERLDVYVDDGRISRGKKWLAVEVEAEGMGSGFWSEVYCGISSGYECLGGEWGAYARSGHKGLLIAYEVDDDARLDGLRLNFSGDGPIFKLP